MHEQGLSIVADVSIGRIPLRQFAWWLVRGAGQSLGVAMRAVVQVVHIDLGVAFEQGRFLNTPELVPFRLTRDIVDGMGAAGARMCLRLLAPLLPKQMPASDDPLKHAMHLCDTQCNRGAMVSGHAGGVRTKIEACHAVVTTLLHCWPFRSGAGEGKFYSESLREMASGGVYAHQA